MDGPTVSPLDVAETKSLGLEGKTEIHWIQYRNRYETSKGEEPLVAAIGNPLTARLNYRFKSEKSPFRDIGTGESMYEVGESQFVNANVRGGIYLIEKATHYCLGPKVMGEEDLKEGCRSYYGSIQLFKEV